MEFRRVYSPGGTYFFTVVTYKRQPIFTSPEAVELLRAAFRSTLERFTFTIVASVILPDHLHCIWTLPPGDSDYSTRWKFTKTYFTKHWSPQTSLSANVSRQQKGEKDIWQRRFWEHLIRDEQDLHRHLDYIHFNPVKHGLVSSPQDWEYSSLHKFIREGQLPSDWGRDLPIWTGDLGME